MIFVFDSEGATLTVQPDPATALQGLPSDELRRQRWLFFAADGSPLRVDCLADGSRQFRPWASCSSCRLEQILPWITRVSGPSGLDSVSALRLHLALI